jgi:23S rRNA (uridine2552-2'-O)-methyltransferase
LRDRAHTDDSVGNGCDLLTIDFARRVLKPNGTVLIKTFQGAGFTELVESARLTFNKVRFAKPDASRPRSFELYLLASGFRMV